MKSTEVKIFNQWHILMIILLVFIINYAAMTLYSIRLDWQDSEGVYVLGKSVTLPFIFLIWFLATPLVVFFKNRFPYSNTTKKNILIHLAISLIMAVIISFLAKLLTIGMLYFFGEHYYQEEMTSYFGNIDMYLLNIRFVGVLIYWLTFIYLSNIDFYKKYKNESLKRAEAESLITRAELNALKMQIQPHFLFNTLHSISSLIDEDTIEAQDVIGRLGDLLRYTLDQQKEDFITLKTELSFVENYLEIERVRFKNRLQVFYKIEQESKECYIASFILQPLIENAIKHGLAKTNRRCMITVTSKVEGDFLCISVSDNGNGSDTIEKGVGIDNIEQRLKNYYGDNFRFNYHNLVPHGFQATMYIPLRFESSLSQSYPLS